MNFWHFFFIESIKNLPAKRDFMDKKKHFLINRRIFKTKAVKTALFCFNLLAFFAGVFLSLFVLGNMAKRGSDFFYYAMAFASPGSAIEYLNQPFEEENILSTDVFEEEQILEPEEETEHEAVFKEPVFKEAPPEIPENRRGKITETKYSAKEGGIYIGFEDAIIKNCTTKSTQEIKSKLLEKHDLSLSTELGALPQVLIYHTHATEGFEPYDSGVFDKNGTWRSTDNSKNMVAVGDALETVLNKKGVGVIHNKTLHDDPSYNGSYGRSAVTVTEILEEYPTVEVCIDLHRDAIEPSENEIIKPTVVINGKKAAQIMIISGCDNGKLNMPNYWENLRFAAALAAKLEELFPGITRPILFDYRKYNMDLSPGLLLIEIGATGNTLEEAVYSAELLGEALYSGLTE